MADRLEEQGVLAVSNSSQLIEGNNWPSVGESEIFEEEEEENEEDDTLVPPENWSMVTKGVYRSAFPKSKNFKFLKKLGLKSLLTLILEDYPDQNKKFLQENNVSFYQFGVPGNKEPFVDIPEDKVCAALSIILNKENHPLLIHCNKGKHRTGCLVGCLRKFQHWSFTSIFEEYRRFAFPKPRLMDQQFIELFDIENVPVDRSVLPAWPEFNFYASLMESDEQVSAAQF